MNTANPAYNLTWVGELNSGYQHRLLEQAFTKLVERHYMLRCQFKMTDDGLQKRIGSQYEQVNISIESSSGELLSKVQELADFPFDLHQGPLYRVGVIHHEGKNYVLLVVHHIIADHIGFQVLLNDWMKLYHESADEIKANLPVINFDFDDYLNEHRLLDKEAARKFWLQRLNEAKCNKCIAKAEILPTKNKGALYKLAVPEDLIAQLKQFNCANATSTYSLALSAFISLQLSYAESASMDVSIGVPYHNRQKHHSFNIMGSLVTVYPFICSANSLSQSIQGAVKHVYSSLMEQFQHSQFTPDELFDHTQRKLLPVLENEMIFNWHEVYDFDELLQFSQADEQLVFSKEILSSTSGISGCVAPLVVTGQLDRDVFEFCFSFDTSQYSEERIKVLADEYLALLRALTQQPQKTLINFIQEWRLRRDSALFSEHLKPNSQSLYGRFREMVTLHGDNDALHFDSQVLSYRQLDKQVERVSAALYQLGIKPLARVALYLPSSPEVIVTMLALVRLGAIYVPIDPEFPIARVTTMLETANAELVIGLQQQDESTFTCRYIHFSSLLDTDAQLKEVELIVHDTQPAYIMYTSGTTGKPKGVLVSQLAILRLVVDTDYVSIAANDVFLQSSPICFDAATFEIWGALLNGSSIVLHPKAAYDLDLLSQLYEQYHVSVAFLTSALFRLITEEHITCLSSLRQLLVGGDYMPTTPVQKLFENYSDCEFIHVYGPTENTTFSTFKSYHKQDLMPSALSIGKSIRYSDAYVLTNELKIAPPGVVGELYVGGHGLALEYVSEPQLTQQSFSNVSVNGLLKRLYKTGDMVFRTIEDDIVFVGRNDQQFKIRGFRIELGEINNKLESIDGVQKAHTLVHQINEGESKQLFAFIESDSLSAQQLKIQLREVLPQYMLPNRIIVLPKLPLSHTGKLDKSAMLSIALAELDKTKNVVKNQDIEHLPYAEKIRELFVDVFARDVTWEDNFFELGGDSISAIRLVTRINNLGLKSQVQVLFESVDIADFILQIHNAKNQKSAVAQRKIESQRLLWASTNEALLELHHTELVEKKLIFEGFSITELTPMQQMMLVAAQKESKSGRYWLQYNLDFEGQFDPQLWRECWQQIWQQTPLLRSRFVGLKSSSPALAYDLELLLPWIQVPQSEAPFSQNTFVNWLEQQRLLFADDPESDTMAFHLVQLSENKWRFVWQYQHALFDGWSKGLILQQAFELYEGRSESAGFSSEPFVNFNHWQRELVDAPSQLFWQDYLRDYEKSTAFHLSGDELNDSQRPRYVEFNVVLQQSIQIKLEQFCSQNRLTANIVMQTAFGQLLNRLNYCNDIVFGTVSSGRSAPIEEIENAFGLFLNTIPVRVNETQQTGYLSLLKEAQSHRVACQPYEQRSILSIQQDIDLIQSRLFDYLFIFENLPFGMGNTEVAGSPLAITGQDGTIVQEYPMAMVIEAMQSQYRLKAYCNLQEIDYATADKFLEQYQTYLSCLLDYGLESGAGESHDKRWLALQNVAISPLKHPSLPLQTLPQHLANMANRTSTRIALLQDEVVLDYGTLFNYASALGEQWLQSGGQSGDCVGVAVSDRLTRIACFYGITMTGGVYVPLMDINSQHSQYIIADSKIRYVFIESKYANDTIQCLEPVKLGAQPQSPVAVWDDLDSPAYVIYTSGSTGKPKGVVNLHLGLANLHAVCLTLGELTQDERILQLSSPTFDASIFEYTWALSRETALVTWQGVQMPVGDKLADLVEQAQVTQLVATPSIWQTLIDNFPGTLVMAVSAGEALPKTLLNRMLQHVPVVNAYGPTETTVVASMRYYERYSEVEKVTLGSAIDNTMCCILDTAQNLLPIGIAGEIAIVGKNVSQGYIQPELTLQRFFDIELAGCSQVVYRTGDIGVMTEQHELIYLGRIDSQAKINGVRIELEQIEQQLLKHSSVKDVVVRVISLSEQNKILTAFVISKDWCDGDDLKLLEYLRTRLPTTHCPSLVLSVSSLPVTSSGKLDERQLQQQVLAYVSSRKEPLGALTPELKKLVNIFSQVMGVEELSVEDNIFHCGAHSLTLLKLSGRIESELGIQISLEDFFTAPTINSFAMLLEQKTIIPELTVCTEHYELVSEFPLSAAQKRIWLVEQLSQKPIYHVPMAIRIEGQLDETSFVEALQQVLGQQELVRCSVIVKSGEPWHQLQPQAQIACPVVECDDKESMDVISAFTAEPLCLDVAPLCKARLLRLSNNSYIFVIVFHHLIFDGFSSEIFFNQLSEYYNDKVTPKVTGNLCTSNSVPVVRPYQAYVAQEYSYSIEHLEYWQTKLEELPKEISLPHYQPRAKANQYQGAQCEFKLPSHLVSQASAFCQTQAVTPFMLYLGVFTQLLARYSGMTDIAVGSPVLGRGDESWANTIGMFTNSVVLRQKLNPEHDFIEFMGDVKESVLGAMAHQDVPFLKLVENLENVIVEGVSPLYQVQFILQNEQQYHCQLADTKLELIDLHDGIARFDLTLMLRVHSDGRLSGKVEYATGLFQADWIATLCEHYITLLEQCLNNHTQTVLSLPLIMAEIPAAMEMHNTQSLQFEMNKVFAIFSEQNALRGDRDVTYGQLEALTTQLIGNLTSQLDLGSVVGVSMKNKLDMVICAIALIRAGFIYLPLDPSYPKARLEHILTDAKPALIIVDDELKQSVADFVKVSTYTQLLFDEYVTRQKMAEVSNEASAYLIYTSGSTGKPKGVLLEHVGLLNLAQAQIDTFQVKPQSQVLQFAPLSFDASISEIFMAFLSGATLCIPQESAPNELPNIIDRWQISVATLPPSVIQLLGDLPLTSLKTLASAGEKCPLDIALKHRDRRRFINAYGPTETTVCAAMSVITEHTCLSNAQVPVGAALPHHINEVRDSLGNLVPDGVTGEIYVIGIGVSPGYWGNESQTKSVFSLANTGRSRVYQTGDLGYIDGNGELVVVGRKDRQVKVRGFRIEPSEVEAVLLALPHIQFAAVVQAAFDPNMLVAHLYGDGIEAGLREEIIVKAKAEIHSKLPAYMRPNVISWVDKIPLDANNKVDYDAIRSLPVIELLEQMLPARNPTEEYLCAIFAKYLGLDEIGIRNNFFDAGGHSLAAAKVIAKISEKLMVTIEFQYFFEHATVEELAWFIDSLLEEDWESEQFDIEGTI
ncbi:amino acid adenylation domain-containing protein [Pseudoalteromonas prydzensis]|uniref:Amino acid adenylation domain-containing protein n=2 Tax=Pseudoalteromonas prydzensis TaxID=182141 RepID=A0ABR9FPA4_9GAMM|nr:amino acid adenylation domain-containing protein [Pseudoalteromonas prydzensis]